MRTLGRFFKNIKPSRDWLVVLAVLGAALLFKLVYLVYYAQQMPFYAFPMGDSALYLDWARNIILNDFWSLQEPFKVFYRAPLYPYLLALNLKVFGGSLLPVYLFQFLLGTFNLFLTYIIAKRLFSHWVGIAAIALAALYAPLTFMESKLISMTLVITFVLLAVWFLLESANRGQRSADSEQRPAVSGQRPAVPGWRWLVSGLFMGLGTLAWGGTIVLVPLAFVFWLFQKRRIRFACYVLLAVGWFVAILPATLHNVLGGNDFVLVNSNSGYTFYQGNNPGASGTIVHPPEVYEQTYGGKFPTGIGEQQFFDLGYAARTMQKDSIKPSEASWFWMKRGLGWIIKNPGDYVRLEFQKLVLMLSNYEFASNYFLSVEKAEVPVLHIAFIPFALIFALGMLGIIFQLKQKAKHWPVYLMIIGTVLVLMVFYVGVRYRLPLILPLAVFGGVGVNRIIGQWRKKRVGIVELGTTALFLLVSWIFCTVPMSGRHAFVTSLGYRNLGECFHRQAGNLTKARKAYDHALALHEEHSYFGRTILTMDALAGLFTLRGDVLFDEQKLDSAIADYRAAQAADPRKPRPVSRLAFAFYAKGTRQPDRSSEQSQSLLDTALTYVQDWYRSDTMNTSALALEGDIHMAQTDTSPAITSYQKLVSIDPRFAPASFAMADIYLAREQTDQALEVLQGLAMADTLHVGVRLAIGDLYSMQADSAAALTSYLEAAQLDTLNLLPPLKLAMFYSSQHNHIQAKEVLQTAVNRVESPGITLAPQSPAVSQYLELKLRLAAAHLNLHEWNKAAAQAQGVLKLVPNHQTALQLLNSAQQKEVPKFILW